MKFFKYSLYTLVALAVSAAFTACDEDDVPDKYTPGAPSDGPYFSSTLAETYDVSAGESSVTFDLSRANGGDEATYSLEVKNPDPEIFTIPAQVTFAKDATSAPVTISFDNEKIADGAVYDFDVTVADASTYGVGSYVFTIMKPEPWETIGTGIYVDDIACSLYNIGGGKTLSWEVEIQKHGQDEGLYRLVNPYATMAKMVNGATFDSANQYNITFRIRKDNSVVFTPNPFCTGLTLDPTYGVIYGAQMSAGIGEYKDGVITFPTDGFGAVEQSEYGQGWYKANTHGAEMIVFPGVELTDYSATIEYSGFFTAPDNSQQAVVNVAFGADVENARVACAITTDVQALVNSIVSGDIEFVETTQPGEVRLPLEGAGEYTAVIVTYGDGEPQLYAATEFEILGSGAVDEGNWTSLGQCDFIDGWFSVGLNFPNGPSDALNYPASVEIQKSDDTPGVYRLMAPYTNESYVGLAANQIQKVRNIVINCENPSYCFVEAQKSGWGNSGVGLSGELYICDGGWLYPASGILQPAQVVAKGLGSTLTVDADGVSTININAPFFGTSEDPDDQGYSFTKEGQPMIPSTIMFIEEDTPAAKAALQKKVIAKTIDMLTGKIERKASKSINFFGAGKGVAKYKYNKKANGTIL